MQKSSIEGEQVNIVRNKTRWRSIRIPESLYRRIKEIIAIMGYPSVPEYIRERINDRLPVDEMRAQDFKDHLEELKEMKE